MSSPVKALSDNYLDMFMIPFVDSRPEDLGEHGWSEEVYLRKLDRATPEYCTENGLTHLAADTLMGTFVLELASTPSGCGTFQTRCCETIPKGLKVGDKLMMFWYRDRVPGWGHSVGLLK